MGCGAGTQAKAGAKVTPSPAGEGVAVVPAPEVAAKPQHEAVASKSENFGPPPEIAAELAKIDDANAAKGPLADEPPDEELNEEESTKAVDDAEFVKSEMRKARGKGVDDHLTVKRIHRIAKARIKVCSFQKKEHKSEAQTKYAAECADFKQRHPAATKAYDKLNAVADKAAAIPGVAFYVGFCEGLANTELDPEELAGQVLLDWEKLKVALKNFGTCPAVTAGGSTFEDDDDTWLPDLQTGLLGEITTAKDRTKAICNSLKPVVTNILAALTSLSQIYTELAGPVLLVTHIVKMCTPPFLEFVKQVVKDAYHFAHKKDREEDLAAIHFLAASWRKLPCTHEQWHDIGRNLGIMILAFVGV